MKQSAQVSITAQQTVNSLFFIFTSTNDDRVDKNVKAKCKNMIDFLSQKFQTLRLPESFS